MQGVTHAELGAVGAGRRLQSVRLVLRDTDHRLVTVKVKLGALSGPFVSSLVCSTVLFTFLVLRKNSTSIFAATKL